MGGGGETDRQREGGGRERKRQRETDRHKQTGTTGRDAKQTKSSCGVAGLLCPLRPWGTSQNTTLADRGGGEGETDKDRQRRGVG